MSKIEQNFKAALMEGMTTMSGGRKDLILNVGEKRAVIDTETKEKEYLFNDLAIPQKWDSIEVENYVDGVNLELSLYDKKEIDLNNYEKVIILDGKNKVTEYDTETKVAKNYEIVNGEITCVEYDAKGNEVVEKDKDAIPEQETEKNTEQNSSDIEFDDNSEK
jgi:hypothetical protein